MNSMTKLKAWFELCSINHFWFKSRFSAFLKISAQNAVKFNIKENMLDIGCGVGILSQQIFTKFSTKLDLFDITPIYFKKYISKIPHRNFYTGKLVNINFKKKYHKVFLFDVIEHLTETELKFLFKKISKILRNDGIIAINVPSLKFLFSQYDISVGHKKRYNKKDLSDLAVKFNYNIKCIEYWGVLFILLLFFRKIYLFFFKKKIVQTTFHVKNNFLNFMLYFIYKIENIFNSLPIGTSIICILEKKKLKN